MKIRKVFLLILISLCIYSCTNSTNSQIDSLLEQTKMAISKQDYQKATDLLEEAEKLSVEHDYKHGTLTINSLRSHNGAYYILKKNFENYNNAKKSFEKKDYKTAIQQYGSISKDSKYYAQAIKKKKECIELFGDASKSSLDDAITQQNIDAIITMLGDIVLSESDTFLNYAKQNL